MATSQDSTRAVRRGDWAGWLKLLCASLAIVVVWGWGLPAISRLPPQRHYESWLDDHRIDPSAMFYTEVEMFEPILKRREAR